MSTNQASYLFPTCQVFVIIFYFGKKTKPQTITKSQKGSQTGAGQGREGLDNAFKYACRVEGESTAVFLSLLYSPFNDGIPGTQY